MEYDLDDPLPIESGYWSFWNRFAEDWMRFVRLFGFLALLAVLVFPHEAKAQNAGYGIVCDTADQVRRYVLADDTQSSLAAIQRGERAVVRAHEVSFYVGKVDATIVSKDGVWEITHILIVDIAMHGGIRPAEPTPRWIAIAVASKPM